AHGVAGHLAHERGQVVAHDHLDLGQVPAVLEVESFARVVRAHHPVDVQRHQNRWLPAPRPRARIRSRRTRGGPFRARRGTARRGATGAPPAAALAAALAGIAALFLVFLVIATSEEGFLGSLEHPLGLATRAALGHILDHLWQRLLLTDLS